MRRLSFVDALRGIAVVAMVAWHTVDAWIVPGLKAGEGWAALRTFGGMAAPLFLFLSGVSASLAMGDGPAGARRIASRVGRGLEVIVWGYALRLQAWLLDAGAWSKPATARAWLPILVGFGFLIWAARRMGDAPRKASIGMAAGLTLAVAGYAQVESVSAGRLARLLQVDVLQAIGAGVVIVSLGHGMQWVRRPGVSIAIGVAWVIATPFIWNAMPGDLPVPVAAFLGRFTPADGGVAASRFPLFPWVGYAWLGAAVAVVLNKRNTLDATDKGDRVGEALVWLTASGALLSVATSEALPHMFRLLRWMPDAAQPMRVCFRLGIISILMLIAWVITHHFADATRWLRDMGRTSLRIYWVHLMFAYGIFGRPLKKQLSYTEWALCLAVLLLGMWGLSRLSFSRRNAGAKT